MVQGLELAVDSVCRLWVVVWGQVWEAEVEQVLGPTLQVWVQELVVVVMVLEPILCL